MNAFSRAGWAHARRYTVLSRGLWGGAIGVLFLVMFAGYRVHGILSQAGACTGMALATVLGAAISIVYRARSAAVLAALGGYLTPWLLSSDRQGFVFAYLAILTAGLLFVGWWHRWVFLRPLALAGSVLWFAAWWTAYGAGDRDLMVGFVGLFFALFAVDAAAWSATRRAAPQAWVPWTLGALAAAHGTVGLVLLLGRRPEWVGPFLGATALFCGALALLVHRRHAEDHALARVLGWSAALFLLFVPALDERFRPYGVSIAWAVTALLFLATTRLGSGASGRAWALAALLLAAVRLLAFDTPRHFVSMDPHRILLTERGLVYGLVIAAYVVGWWWLRRLEAAAGPRPSERSPGSDWAGFEHGLLTLVLLMATTLPLVLLSLELRDALAHYVRPAFEGREQAWTRSTNWWMDVLWIAYLTLLLTVARLRGSIVLVRLALTLGVIVLWKVVVSDLAHLYEPETVRFANQRTLVLALLAACLFWSRFVLARDGPAATTLPVVGSTLAGLGHLAVQTALALEWHDLVHERLAAGWTRGDLLLGLSVLAAVHGTLLLLWAARRRTGAMLVPGVALLALATFEYGVLYLLSGPAPTPRLLFHLRLVAGAVVAAGLFLGGRALGHFARDDDERATSWALPGWAAALGVCGHLVALAALGMEACDVFRRGAFTPEDAISVVRGPAYAVVAVAAVYGGLLAAYGLLRPRAAARVLGLVVLWATLVGLLAVVFTGRYETVLHVVLNTRFLLGGLLPLALFLAGEAYHRVEGGAAGEAAVDARRGRATLVLVGHAVALFLLTLEANDAFTLRGQAGAEAGGISPTHARQLAFSVVWALYAIGMVVAGALRAYRPVRLMALAILLGTILKVFLFDLSFLENPYRILSFLALGLILVGVSYVYQRYKGVLFGDEEEET